MLRLPGWISRFAGLAAEPPKALMRVIRAKYDAAGTDDENRKHWRDADILSADAASNPAVRRTLRIRARYEVANNSYARGIVSTIANDTIGTGPRLQLLNDNPDDERASKDYAEVERLFGAWCEAIGFAEKLRTMRMARVQDGESFAVMVTNPAFSPVPLDLRLFEADQVMTPYLNLWGQPGAIDGIEFDSSGNPAVYHILKQHPGSMYGISTFDYDTVPAEDVIHYFRADRPGQSRGIPEITAALPLFAQLRRYTLAVIGAAELAAEVAGVLETTAPEVTAPGDEEPEPFSAQSLERDTVVTMPAGWKLQQLKAEQPTTTYKEFKGEVLCEIARCLNMPFNIAAGNSSGYNYSSGRLDHQTYFRANRIDQDMTERVVCDRVLAQWFEFAVAAEILPPRMRGAISRGEFPRHAWFWDGEEHVDPRLEAEAQAMRIASGTTNLAIECAREGKDWEQVKRQRARELKLDRELGITPPPAPVLTPKEAGIQDATEPQASAA